MILTATIPTEPPLGAQVLGILCVAAALAVVALISAALDRRRDDRGSAGAGAVLVLGVVAVGILFLDRQLGDAALIAQVLTALGGTR
jgi:hypothetical protein